MIERFSGHLAFIQAKPKQSDILVFNSTFLWDYFLCQPGLKMCGHFLDGVLLHLVWPYQELISSGNTFKFIGSQPVDQRQHTENLCTQK